MEPLCLDNNVDLLEAIYELDKLIMMRTINNKLVKFLPVAKQYISFLKESNDDIQVKIETDFINDIINHNGLGEHSTWYEDVECSDISKDDIEEEYLSLKSGMNLAVEAYIDNFLLIAYLYSSILKQNNNEDKIKNVFDYIAGIIVDKSKHHTWCIKYKSLYDGKSERSVFFKFLNIAANCENTKNGYAQFLLGNCFLYGKYVEEYHKSAFEWYKNSAENGCAEGMVGLGWYYQNGYGMDKPVPEKAFHWFEKSAKNGCTGGMNNLGWCYENGYGIDKPVPKQAFHWYKKGAEKDDTDAIEKLIWCYEKGYGTEPDAKEVAFWRKKLDEKSKV